MSEREYADQLAKEKYDMDYKGILLNTIVSLMSGLSATAVTSFITSIPTRQLPVVTAGIVIAQVLPKLFIELHKSYFQNKAKREAYMQGLLDDGKPETKVFHSFLCMCEDLTYF